MDAFVVRHFAAREEVPNVPIVPKRYGDPQRQSDYDHRAHAVPMVPRMPIVPKVPNALKTHSVEGGYDHRASLTFSLKF